MSEQKVNWFARYAWFALGYNLLVILWGVFLRASYSGDGCGQHWLTCQGEAIPSAPELKTIIEFSHRLTTALAGIDVVVLAGWALSKHHRGDRVRLFAVLALLFIIIEGAIGGGLVLTGNTAGNWTPTRPYWTAGHLINTFILLAFLALTAWSATDGNRRFRQLTASEKSLITVAALAIFVVGIFGSMASLAHMLFPSESISESIGKDFDPNSHWLLRLRILHPITSILSVVFLIFAADWLKRRMPQSLLVARWAGNLTILLLLQTAFGALTLLMLAPILMQLGHLLIADLIWIAFVLLCANFAVADDAND